MLRMKPILNLITLYQAFIHGILYLVFVIYPVTFREVRRFSLGISGLTEVGMLIGILLDNRRHDHSHLHKIRAPPPKKPKKKSLHHS